MSEVDTSNVIFETPDEVRQAITDLMQTDKLLTTQFIGHEAQRILPKVLLRDINLFLTNSLSDPVAFPLVYAALYYFLEHHRDETGVPKSSKRVLLEQAYILRQSPVSLE